MSEMTNTSYDQEQYLRGHADGWSNAEKYDIGDYVTESIDVESRYESFRPKITGWAYNAGWVRGFLTYVESLDPASAKKARDQQMLERFRGYFAGRQYAAVEQAGGALSEQLYYIASQLDGTGFSGIIAENESFDEEKFFEAVSAPRDNNYDYLLGVRQGIYDYLELQGCDSVEPG